MQLGDPILISEKKLEGQDETFRKIKKKICQVDSELPQLSDFFKVALNPLHRIVLNFAESFIMAF